MKKILILEDNAVVRGFIKEVINNLEIKTEVYDFDNLLEAYQCALEKQIDCFIVDIILDTKVPGDTSGLKFVESMRKIQTYILSPIIIVTSLEDAKMYAYERLHCYSFLEKPFSDKQLQALLLECLGMVIRKENKTLYFNIDNVIMVADVCDIVYVEKVGRGIQIHTRRLGELKVPYKTIKAFIAEAECPDMMQCSRFCVVNRNYIQNYDQSNCIIQLVDDLGKIEVGRRYKRKMQEGLR